MINRETIYLAIKRITRKPLFWIGAVIFYFFISYCLQESDNRIDKSRINSNYSDMDLTIKPQNKYHEEYDLLIKEFQKFKMFNVIAKSRGGIIFGRPCKILGDYFTIPRLKGKFMKTITDKSNPALISPLYNSNDSDKLYTKSEIEHKERFTFKGLNDIFGLMSNLNIKWISREKNFIEFANEVYPADESLDYYNGYFYCLNDSIPQINKDNFYLLYQLEDNWYYFIRETYKGPVIFESRGDTTINYFQYLENVKK